MEALRVANPTAIHIFTVPIRWNAVEFRYTGATDNASDAYDIFFMKTGGDHYTRTGTHTVITGTQPSSITGEEFCDQITTSNSRWKKTWQDTSGDDNYIGDAVVDVFGIHKIAVVKVTDGNDGHVEISGA
jgi:hypothetical protein